MIAIENIIISDELAERHFVCNLKACKGGCCVEGDSGAPLKKEETKILEAIYPSVKKYLTKEGREAIEENGAWDWSRKDKFKTPLIKGGACAYVRFEKGVAKCGIEKAYQEGKIDFQKPISCHLYPVRVKEKNEMHYLNYHEWEICDPACELGDKLKVPVYQFVKDALIREYGEEFFKTLEAAVKHQENKATPVS